MITWNAARMDNSWYVVSDERGVSLVDRETLTSLLRQFFTTKGTGHDTTDPAPVAEGPLG